MSRLSVGQLEGLTVNNNVISVPSGHTLTYGGAILQIVQTVKTDASVIVPGAIWGDIPGMSVTIAPKFSTSRIFVMVDVKVSGTQGASIVRTKLQRNNSDIYIGNAASNRPRSMGQFYGGNSDAGFYMAQVGGNFLDSPSTTSSVTYKVQIGGDGTGSTLYVNRTQVDRDNAGMDARGASSITLMEIAQ